MEPVFYYIDELVKAKKKSKKKLTIKQMKHHDIKTHRGALETYRSLLSWHKSEMEISRYVPER